MEVKSSRNPSDISERLREARQWRGFTQGKVAEHVSEAGWSAGTSNVSDYEQGVAPKPGYLAAFCRALSVNPLWLLLGEGPRSLREAKETGGPADARYLERRIRTTLEEVMGELEEREPSADLSDAAKTARERIEGDGSEEP